MSKVKLTEQERSKMTELEITTHDNQVSFCGIVLLLSVLGLPSMGVLWIANIIWSSKVTWFLALSSSLVELLLLVLLWLSLIGLSSNVKKLKEKLSTR